MESLGSTIRNFRKRKGVEAKEMAAALGISASYLSSIENDKLLPSTQMISDIAGYFNLSPKVLLLLAFTKDDFKVEGNYKAYQKLQPLLAELTNLLLPVSSYKSSAGEPYDPCLQHLDKSKKAVGVLKNVEVKEHSKTEDVDQAGERLNKKLPLASMPDKASTKKNTPRKMITSN